VHFINNNILNQKIENEAENFPKLMQAWHALFKLYICLKHENDETRLDDVIVFDSKYLMSLDIAAAKEEAMEILERD
jgi:hypothetical protein